MRIGIDCRAHGAARGYMDIYMEHFVSYLEQNKDTNEYILFFNERELSDFSTESDRLRAVKTAAKMGNFSGQVLFAYELQREKLDLMLFSSPNIPFLYFGKSIIILSDLISYFYPEKHRKGSWMRLLSNLILRRSIHKAASIIAFSETLKRDIIEIFDTPEDKISVIPPMSFPVPPVKEAEMQKFYSQEYLSEKYLLSI